MRHKAATLATLLMFALALGACKQSAGDRCQVDRDCEEGLICCVKPSDRTLGGTCQQQVDCELTQVDAGLDDAGATDAEATDAEATDAEATDAEATDSAPPADSTVDSQAPADSTVDSQAPADSTVDSQAPADSTADTQAPADSTVDAPATDADAT